MSRFTVWVGAILAAALALSPIPSAAGRRGGSGGGNKNRRSGGGNKPKPRRGPNKPRANNPRANNPRSNRSGTNPRTGQQRGTRGGRARGGRAGTAWGNRPQDRALYRQWGLFLPDLGMGQGYGWGFPRDAQGNIITVNANGNPYPVPMAPDGTPVFTNPQGRPLPPNQWVGPTGQKITLPANPDKVADGTVNMSSAGDGTSTPQRRSLRRR